MDHELAAIETYREDRYYDEAREAVERDERDPDDDTDDEEDE